MNNDPHKNTKIDTKSDQINSRSLPKSQKPIIIDNNPHSQCPENTHLMRNVQQEKPCDKKNLFSPAIKAHLNAHNVS